MKKVIAFFMCILMCFTLTGCMPFLIPFVSGVVEGLNELEESEGESGDYYELPDWADEDYDPATAEWGEGNPEGSAVLLDGRTVLITVY